MSIRYSYNWLLCLLVCITTYGSYAQQQEKFRFEIHLTPGINISQIERTITPDSSDYTRGGLSLTAKLLWHPDNKLGIGIESGFIRISSLRVFKDDVIPDNSVIQLNTIPVLGVAEISVLGIDVSGAVGAFNYAVFLGGTGIRASSSNWEIGYSIGLGKAWGIGSNFMLGFDTRYYRIPERDVTLFSGSVRIQYNLIY